MTRMRYADREKWLEQKRRANAKNVEYRRNWHLSKRYGITAAEYDTMFSAQDGGCAICGEPSRDGRRLHV